MKKTAVQMNSEAVRAANRRAEALCEASRRMGRLGREMAHKAEVANSRQLADAAAIIVQQAQQLQDECDAEWAVAQRLCEVGYSLINSMAEAA